MTASETLVTLVDAAPSVPATSPAALAVAASASAPEGKADFAASSNAVRTGETGINGCSFCHRPGADIRCGRCLVYPYCNRKCQCADYMNHKAICDSLALNLASGKARKNTLIPEAKAAGSPALAHTPKA